MTRSLITGPTREDGTLYTLVASTKWSPLIFQMYMESKGLKLIDSITPNLYRVDYSLTGKGGIKVAYSRDTPIEDIRSPILMISGLEQSVVEAEADAILKEIGEVEDPESAQQFVYLIMGTI